MIELYLLTAIIQAASKPASFEGFYENPGKDVRLFLSSDQYRLETGKPLTAPYDQRHVDFESGLCKYSTTRVSMTQVVLFHSPGRWSYMALMGGGMHPGYQQIFKTKEEQVRFLRELKWRSVKKGTKWSAITHVVHGEAEVVIDGVPLKRAPWPAK